MISLSSSAISAVGYDPVLRTLTITFNSGGTYSFYGVPPHIYSGLVGASSPGTYYHNNIRGRYR